MAAAEHGVASDTLAKPRRIHSVADYTHRAAPFVPEAERIAATGITDPGRVAMEQRRIGAADAGAYHIDDDLTSMWRRRRDVLNDTDTGTCDEKRSHYAESSLRASTLSSTLPDPV
jgi:hypothetical protein